MRHGPVVIGGDDGGILVGRDVQHAAHLTGPGVVRQGIIVRVLQGCSGQVQPRLDLQLRTAIDMPHQHLGGRHVLQVMRVESVVPPELPGADDLIDVQVRPEAFDALGAAQAQDVKGLPREQLGFFCTSRLRVKGVSSGPAYRSPSG